MFAPEPRLTAPAPGVCHLADKAGRVVAPADQGVCELEVTMHNADAVHVRQTL